jgi:integrase
LADLLRDHRKRTVRIALEAWRGPTADDGLLFGDLDSNPPPPTPLARRGAILLSVSVLPDMTFHSLRHAHASQLIDAGVDIVTISRRLGHAKPDITLRIYAHLFRKDDGKAAAAINATFKR